MPQDCGDAADAGCGPTPEHFAVYAAEPDLRSGADAGEERFASAPDAGLFGDSKISADAFHWTDVFVSDLP